MFQWLTEYGWWLGLGALGGLVACYLLLGTSMRHRLRSAAEAASLARDELSESERRYRLLAENATDVIWTLSVPDLRYTYISPSITRMRGISVEEAMRGSFPESVVPEQRDWIERLVRNRIRAFESGRFEQSEAQRLEVRQPCVDGREITVEIIASLMVDERRRVTGIQGISRNVTARVRAERERQAREAILHGLARAARTLFSATDKDAVMVEALASLGEAVGVDRTYVFENHRHPETGVLLASQRYEWCGPGVQSELDNPDMQDMPYDDTIPNWRRSFEAGRPVYGLVRDMPEAERTLLEPQQIVSIVVVPIFIDGEFWGQIGFDDCSDEREWSQAEIDALQVAAGVIGGAIRGMRTEAELRRLVSTDSLTGLSSRRIFLERAREQFEADRAEGNPLSLLIMDLDHFKSVNDTHGHPVGDEALQIFARICRQTLRDDDLIGRTGGEEFAVLLSGAGEEVAMKLGEKLRRRVRETPVPLGGDQRPLYLSVSVGVATLNGEEQQFGELLKRADDALYTAKRRGRDRVERAG